MLEIYLDRPLPEGWEAAVLKKALEHGGRCTFRESDPSHLVLTVEFEVEANADATMQELRSMHLHVEGPYDY